MLSDISENNPSTGAPSNMSKNSLPTAAQPRVPVPKHRTPGRLGNQPEHGDPRTAGSTAASQRSESAFSKSMKAFGSNNKNEPVGHTQPSQGANRGSGQSRSNNVNAPLAASAQKAAVWIQHDADRATKPASRPGTATSQPQIREASHARTPSAGSTASRHDLQRANGKSCSCSPAHAVSCWLWHAEVLFSCVDSMIPSGAGEDSRTHADRRTLSACC